MNTKPTYKELEIEVKKLRKELETYSSIKETILLNDILNSSTEISIAITDINLNVIFFNPKAEEIFGYKASEVIGKNLTEIHAMEKVEFKRIEDALEIVKETGNYEYWVNTETKYLKSNVRGIWNKEKELEGFVLFTSDMTVHINTQKEIKKLSTAVEQSANTIVITDTDGNIEYTNKKFTELTGYTAEEVLGKNTSLLNSGIQSTEFYTEMWQKIKAEKTWKGEFCNKTKQGVLYWEDVTITPIKDKGETISFLAIKEDITARKKIEIALSKSENRFKNIFENSPTGIITYDLKGNAINVNNQVLKILGSPSIEATKQINALKFENLRKIGFSDSFIQCVKTRETIKRENYYTTNWNQHKYIRYILSPIIENGIVTSILCIYEDFTKRKKIEQELKAAKEKAELSESRLKTFINSIPDIVCYKDEKGRWLLANKADLELFCLTDVDYFGKTDNELADYTDDIYKEAFSTCMISDEETWKNKKISHGIEIIPTISGISKTYDVFKIPIFHSNGDRKGLAVIGRDISELKNTQEKLFKAKEKAEESNKLKTEFFNNMSHEIRTPMNAILGFSQLLESPDLNDLKRTQYVNIINQSGNQLLRIIDDILEISSLETKQVKIIDKEICLNDLLLEKFSIFEIKAKENNLSLYLNKGLTDAESTIITDPLKLNKILDNLLENALKFTNSGYIEFGYKIKKSEIELYVKDTGIGIKPESQKMIFNRFSQEEKSLGRNFGGLGLGLSIAKENTELLGGKITLQSEKGEGSVFFVTIPYKPANTIIEKIIVDNEIDNEQEKYTILIAEDEEVNYLYIEILLEKSKLNIEILHAKNGEEAVEVCKENADIKLVFMDLKMPIMTGFEAAKQIKVFRPNLTIIALTAYSTNIEKEQALSAGCNAFISKPIDKESLYEILYESLAIKE